MSNERPLSPEAKAIMEKYVSASDISDDDMKIILGVPPTHKIVRASDDELWSMIQRDRIRDQISKKE